MPASVATKSARLSSTELHQLKWILGNLLALISLWTLYSQPGQSSPLVPLITFGLLVMLVFPPLPGRIPPGFWKAGPPLLILIVAIDFVLHRASILEPLQRMVLLLTFYRCLQYRRCREDLQLILLCLFMAVVAGVLNPSPAFGLQLLLFTPLAMAALFVNVILEPTKDRILGREHWEGFSWPTFAARIWRGLDLRLITMAGALFVSTVGVSSLIFFLIPRLQMDQALPFLQVATAGQSGFSDTIHFGNVNSITLDDAKAMRIKPPSPERVPSDPYWRMVVLDRYSNGTFAMSEDARNSGMFETRRAYQSDFAARPHRAARFSGAWTLYMEPGISKYMPILGPFHTARFGKTSEFRANPQLLVYQVKSVPSTLFAYELDGMHASRNIPAHRRERALLESIEPGWHTSEEQEYDSSWEYPRTTLQLPSHPEDRAYLAGLVQSIRNGDTRLSAMEFAGRAVDYLHRNHSYNTASPPVDLERGREPIVRWLQDRSAGWCEHFASAFILLARTAGHPARAVTGFHGGSWNPVENYILVRNSDAHAWAEIYDGEGDGVRVDPTPGSENFNDGRRGGGIWSLEHEAGMQAWLDSLNFTWYSMIISFDHEDQGEMAEASKEAVQSFTSSLGQTLENYYEGLKAWAKEPWSNQRLLRLFAVVFLTAILVFGVRRLNDLMPRLATRHQRLLGFYRAVDPVRKKAGRYLRRFRPLWQEISAHPQADPRALDEYRDTYRRLLALRFAEIDARPAPRDTFRDTRRLLRRRPPMPADN